MQSRLVIVGAGMAGLGSALALRRACPRLQIEVLEQAEAFSEVGAGIQLGPNAVHVLRAWGLDSALPEFAAFPTALSVRDASDGTLLGHLPLAERAPRLYGAPYATLHRADLHHLLLQALRAQGGVGLHLSQRLDSVQLSAAGGVELRFGDAAAPWNADALLGCDGLRSRVRAQCFDDQPPRFSGHLAYRAMVNMARLPPDLRQTGVTAWLGPRMHAVLYPVRRGEWLNVVVIVHGPLPAEPAGWDHPADAHALWQSLRVLAHRDLLRVLEAVPQWRLWPLFVRPPVASAAEMARGPLALLGDAAHPMKPYLAQGAAMALEDAWALGQALARQAAPAGPTDKTDWAALLRGWAESRWRRCAWVQARSHRNGHIFHARGPLRWGRDGAMRLLGARLIDVPRLYAGPAPL